MLKSVAFLALALLPFLGQAAPLAIKDDYLSPRNPERRPRKATTLIVLHTTEGGAAGSLHKLSERGEAHYCVTEKGLVYAIVKENLEAFHAGRSMWNGKEDCDEYSIGIEVVGSYDKTMPLVQLEALKKLVDKLKKTYRLKDSQVVCHSQVAYGAPNTWHKKKHRGRKRCGMLFAMPSVRAKLGLTSRAAADPDVPKRLVQADPYLESVLYGRVDTMSTHYGKGTTALVAVPAPSSTPKVAAKPKGTATPAKPKPSPAVAKASPAKPAPPAAKGTSVPPVVKPPLIVPPAKEEPAAEPPAEESSDWLRTIGLKGGYFRKKAKLVVPSEPKDSTKRQASTNVLPLPENLVIGKAGDEVKDLTALAKLPGYTRGGPVSADLTPFKIAGAAWRSPSTYYFIRGKIIPGDKIDEKSIEAGTFVFYRADAKK